VNNQANPGHVFSFQAGSAAAGWAKTYIMSNNVQGFHSFAIGQFGCEFDALEGNPVCEVRINLTVPIHVESPSLK
jgi:hypothetical protein